MFPAPNGRRLVDIRKADINRIIDQISDRGAGVQAKGVLACLRRFFNWRVERHYLGSNPTDGIPGPHQERARERVLSLDEIRP